MSTVVELASKDVHKAPVGWTWKVRVDWWGSDRVRRSQRRNGWAWSYATALSRALECRRAIVADIHAGGRR